MTPRWEKIVVGGNLEAFIYAYKRNLPLLCLRPKPPLFFECFEVGEELGQMCPSSSRKLRTPSGPVEMGTPKLQVWQRLLFLLSLSGKVLYGDTVKTINVDGDELQISCEGTRRRAAKFGKLEIFDDRGIIGLPGVRKQVKHKNAVYDWVNIVSGGSHNYDLFKYNEDFVNTIYFYPSERNNNSRLKDLVSVSYLTDEQLDDFAYSSTYVRFKLLGLFKELGIRGARNGRDVNRPGYYKYYAVKLEPSERKVVEQIDTWYEKDSRFSFHHQSIKKVLKDESAPNGYLERLLRII